MTPIAIIAPPTSAAIASNTVLTFEVISSQFIVTAATSIPNPVNNKNIPAGICAPVHIITIPIAISTTPVAIPSSEIIFFTF